MLPDALLALWFKLLTDGVLDGDTTAIRVAAIGLGLSATLTWYINVLNQRLQRRFRDRLAIAIEAHIAHLQASVPTIEHQERPEYLDRLAVLRNQSFALDHLFSSLLSNIGVDLPARRSPPCCWRRSTRRSCCCSPPASRPCSRRCGGPVSSGPSRSRWPPHDRLARHLFVVGTTPAPAKEVRVTGIGGDAARPADRRARAAGWPRSPGPGRCRRSGRRWRGRCSASPTPLGIAWVARGLDRSVGDIVLVVVAGQRLSQYIAQTVGELGFLRGVWLDSSLRLTWLEDYAAALEQQATSQPPDRLTEGIRFEHVSFRYPGSDRLALDDVDVAAPGRRRRRHRRRERRRQDDHGQAARRDVPADVGTHHRRRRRPGDDLHAGVAIAPGRGVPGLLPLRAARPPQRRRRRRAAPRRRAGRRRRGRPGRRRRRRRAAAVGLGDAARPDVGRRRRGRRSGSGRSWRWPAGSCATSRWCSCSTSRRRRSTPRPSTPCSSATPTRPATAPATGGSPCSCRTASRPCAWPTSSSCSTARGSSRSGRHDELIARGGQYAELFAIQAGAYR